MKMLRYIIATILFIWLPAMGHAQPANDACGGAQTVTPDSTCYAGTTVSANDNWLGTVGCAGNNDEVWYTFTATASALDYSVEAGTMTGDIEFILVHATGACTGLTLVGTDCGPSILTGTFESLIVGDTYYYTISCDGSNGTFTTCVDNYDPVGLPGQDCSGSDILCSDADISYGTSADGFGVQENSPSISCWGSGGERQSQWFRFSIGCSGQLEFMIQPVTSGDDYDFGLWDITGDTSCASKTSTVACDWSGCKGSTGLSSCPGSEPGAVSSGSGCFGTTSAINAPIAVTAGDHYALLVDNFSTSNDGFTLVFGGACGTGTAVIGPDADFSVSLSADCMTATVDKTCDVSPTTDMTYLWNFGDGTTSTAMEPGSHTYSVDGLYTISLTVTDQFGCTKSFSEVVDIGCVLPIELTDFDAEYVNGRVDMEWVTASEINNDYFTVEKSVDGIHYEFVRKVQAAGYSSKERTYLASDPNPYLGVSYYRLKQTDYDGKFEYFGPVSVNVLEKDDMITLLPNPTSNNTEISFNASMDDEVQLSVLDAAGRVVYSKEISAVNGENRVLLNTADFAEGVYLVTIATRFEVMSTRLVKE